jgi:hypothetical protein
MESQVRGIYIVLIPIGALLVVIGALIYFRMRGSSGKTHVAMGVVVDQEESTSDDGVVYSPIVTFTAHDGTEATFTDSFASYPALYKVGDEVKVLYDPQSFSNARIAASVRRYLGAIIVGALGAIFIVVGWIGLR